jgi:hypothetical protein
MQLRAISMINKQKKRDEGQLGKTKLLNTYGVVNHTDSNDEERFAETPVNSKPIRHFLHSQFENRIPS